MEISWSDCRGNIASAIGGGISASGTVTLKDTTISDNSGRRGGAIYNQGTLTMANGIVAENRATGSNCEGGRMWTNGSLTLTNVSVAGNVTDTEGGACSAPMKTAM